MLRRLIARSYKCINQNSSQGPARAFVEYRRVANRRYYCTQLNRKRINFSEQPNYKSNDCNKSMCVSNNNDPYNMEKWNIVSVFLLAVGVMGCIVLNNKARADEEETKIDDSDLQSPEKLDKLSIKLMEGLPGPVENYIDLQGKREFLNQKLNEKDIIVISGAGGMGKSTLTAQYGNDCKQKGEEVIWIKGTQIEEEFFRLAEVLGIEIKDLSSEMIRNLVYGNLQMLFGKKRILFIFDNVERKERIEKYLINLPRTGKVIITARDGDILDGIKAIRIKGFKEEEADFYLRAGLKISKKEAAKILNVVGDESPFRLSIVVGYLKNHPSEGIDKFTEKYLEIKRGYRANEEIYPEVKMLFRNLKEENPKAWELLKYLAYLDAEGVSVALIGEIMEQTVKELQETINKIRGLSLIKTNERIVKVTHRIIQEETKKALNEEDKGQYYKILEKLIREVDRAYPEVNENPENWGKVFDVVSHAKKLIEETKEINQTVAGRDKILSKIGAYYHYINFNYKEAINFREELLKYQVNVHIGDHDEVAKSLNDLGLSYQYLGGAENVQKALQYFEESLKITQALHSGNHYNVARTLNNIGRTYIILGGTENVKTGLQYQKKSLRMRQAIYPGDHPDVARSLNNVGLAYQDLGGTENVRKGLEKYLEKSLKMRQAIYLGNHPDVARSLGSVGSAYINLGGTENLQKGLEHLKASLEMKQTLYLGKHHPSVAVALYNIGLAYKELGGTVDLQEGLQYQEKSLQMRQALFPGNHPDVARSLSRVGSAYKDLGDGDKALEYLKQAYSINLNIFDEDYTQTKEIKSAIESLQPDFFINQGALQILQQQSCLGGNRVGSECRWIITIRGETNASLLKLKEKIQESVLNKVVESVDHYGWSRLGLFKYEWGVKGYIEKRYLGSQLEGLQNKENNIELAQMLCFEATNLGIMKSAKKPYEVIENFTRANKELVKKIAQEHPEFFVDGTIVEACVRAMPENAEFEEHIFKHVKYMGMEERKKRGL